MWVAIRGRPTREWRSFYELRAENIILSVLPGVCFMILQSLS